MQALGIGIVERVHCRAGSRESRLPAFTAAQAAEKVRLARPKRLARFTAAQAAEKVLETEQPVPRVFTAAQAA